MEATELIKITSHIALLFIGLLLGLAGDNRVPDWVLTLLTLGLAFVVVATSVLTHWL